MPSSISGAIIGDGLKTSTLGDYAKKCQQNCKATFILTLGGTNAGVTGGSLAILYLYEKRW